MTDPEIARMAEGLSEAQRRAIMSAKETLGGRFCISAKVTHRTFIALKDKGVVTLFGFLEPLGNLLRAHLIERSK